MIVFENLSYNFDKIILILIYISKNIFNFTTIQYGVSLHGVMDKVLDCGLKVSEFKLQLHY